MTGEQVLLQELNKEYLGKIILDRKGQGMTVTSIEFDHNYGDCEIWFYAGNRKCICSTLFWDELPTILDFAHKVEKKDSGFIHPYRR